MTESEAIKKLRQHFEYLKHAWKPHPDYETMDAIGYSIQALEKQIPKKPRFYAHNYYCSVCDSLVGNSEFEWQRFKYCDTCGQKLDWSDEE